MLWKRKAKQASYFINKDHDRRAVTSLQWRCSGFAGTDQHLKDNPWDWKTKAIKSARIPEEINGTKPQASRIVPINAKIVTNRERINSLSAVTVNKSQIKRINQSKQVTPIFTYLSEGTQKRTELKERSPHVQVPRHLNRQGQKTQRREKVPWKQAQLCRKWKISHQEITLIISLKSKSRVQKTLTPSLNALTIKSVNQVTTHRVQKAHIIPDQLNQWLHSKPQTSIKIKSPSRIK